MNSPVRKSRRAAAAEAPSKQKLRLWLRLLRTTRTIEANLRDRLRLQFGSTLPRFDVLAALYRDGQDRVAKPQRDGGLTMTALSRQLLVSNGNATVVVDRLVKDGLIQRVTAANDRRSTVVNLTVEGTRQFRAMAEAHEAWITEILAEIAPDDADVLMTLLDRRFGSTLTHGDLG